MHPEKEKRLQRLDGLARFLDSAFRVPGTRFRVGYDALIGLIPGVGDAAGLAASAYFVWEASRFGLPAWTILRMVMNVAVEALVGAIPIAGDLFDFGWKANVRNLRLLRDRLDERHDAASDRRYVLSVILGLVVLLVVAAVLLVAVVVGAVRLVGG